MSRPCLYSIMKLLGHFLDDPPTSPPSRQATMTAQSIGYKTSPSAASSLAASPSVFTFTVTSKPSAKWKSDLPKSFRGFYQLLSFLGLQIRREDSPNCFRVSSRRHTVGGDHNHTHKPLIYTGWGTTSGMQQVGL